KFAVNRKRKPVVKDGQLVKSQAEANNLYQLLECVTPQHYQSFTGAVTLLNTRSIHPGNPKLPKQDFHWSIKEIAKACNEFYVKLFWEEFYAIKDRGFLNAVWLEQLKDLIDNDLSKRLVMGEAFLLRVGRHSGAEALTLNGIRNIRIMQGRGQPAASASQPKTWWLAADDSSSNREMLPFGWVLVEINPTEVNTKLQNWLESSHDKLTTWMQTQVTKQNTLKEADKERQEKLLAERQKELEEVEKERLRIEQKENEKAGKSAQQLLILELNEHFNKIKETKAREQIGGPLYGAMRELINNTTDWSLNDKAELLIVAKQILDYMGASSNKKAKDLLKTLQ
ncbi:MAG: hypothetical protein NTY69_08980, partial [Methylococcales bacterium]|nr:hypothetical protein [Methylococcales bacterium]